MSRLDELSNRFYDRIRHGMAATVADGGTTVKGFDHLRGHKYCLVVTYRRSGEGVPTPVWFGIDAGGKLYFRTFVISAKLRRIQNDAHVRVAPCTVRGKPLGPAADGAARVLGAEEKHAEETIQSNYGAFRRAYERTGGNAEARYVEVEPA